MTNKSGVQFGKHQSPINIQNPIKSDLPDLRFNYKETKCKPHNNGYSIQAFYGEGSLLNVGKHEFKLVEFHFHTPAEHSFDGKTHPMINHIVHQGRNFLAVVAVTIDEGEYNPDLQKLIDGMDKEINFNVSSLLPQSTSSYFYYHGSRTTPPHSENIHWIILKDKIKASKDQIASFKNETGCNARELQESYGRIVKYRD
ncbi:MAG: carbonic anhydrase family protein [Rickettsiales bacterium]